MNPDSSSRDRDHLSSLSFESHRSFRRFGPHTKARIARASLSFPNLVAAKQFHTLQRGGLARPCGRTALEQAWRTKSARFDAVTRTDSSHAPATFIEHGAGTHQAVQSASLRETQKPRRENGRRFVLRQSATTREQFWRTTQSIPCPERLPPGRSPGSLRSRDDAPRRPVTDQHSSSQRTGIGFRIGPSASPRLGTVCGKHAWARPITRSTRS